MKILALSDQKSPYLWDHFEKEKFLGYDAIISCGDLPKDYLSVIATEAPCPLFFVPGNHDHYNEDEPEGCINIDGKILEHAGIRIMGLGGSLRYKNGDNQYTQGEMNMRVLKLLPSIMLRGKPDIIVAHAAPAGLGDDQNSRTHGGFTAFTELIEKFHPALFLHGHVHLNYSHDNSRIIYYGNTRIINAFEKVEITL